MTETYIYQNSLLRHFINDFKGKVFVINESFRYLTKITILLSPELAGKLQSMTRLNRDDGE